MLKNIQRRKRKIIAMVLSVLLVAAVGVGFCYNSNHAEAMIYKDEEQQIVWEYELDGDDNAINVRISGAATEVAYGSSSITTDITVPDAIDGHKVVSIGEADKTNADTFFVGCDVGPSITVDTTGCTALTTVNQYAFGGAAYMTIKLAPTITNIGKNAFDSAMKSTVKTISPNIIFDGEDSTSTFGFKFSAPNQSTAYERYAPLNKYTDNGLQAIKILLDKNDTKAKTGEGLFHQYIYVLTDGSNKDVSKIIIPTKDHYRFLGYFTEQEGGSMVYNENGELQTVEGLQDNDTLYAHWEANTYTITYHADEDVTGSMDKQIVSYDSEFNFSEVGFKKAGYTFAGWAKTKNGTIAYSDFTKTYQNITEEDNIDLYAMWKANTYTFVFNSNGGSGVMYNQTLTYDEDPVALTENAFVKTGYTFMGWSTEKDGEVVYSDKEQLQNEVTESKTIILYAVWKEHTYTITFLSEFVKTNINPITAGYAEKVKLPPCKATRNGYTFVGWSKTVHNQSLWFHDEDTVSSLTAEDKGNIELYAMWEANNYTVNFDGNGATFVPSQQSVIQTYDKLFRLREDYLKTGYKLMGWSTKKHSPFAYEDKDELDSTYYFKPDDSVENLAESGEVTLYAVWYEQQYAIEYFANQDNEYYTKNGEWQTVYTYESGAELPILTSPGYEFLGWVDSSNNLVSRVKPRTTTGIIKLYGKWQKEKNLSQFGETILRKFILTEQKPE